MLNFISTRGGVELSSVPTGRLSCMCVAVHGCHNLDKQSAYCWARRPKRVPTHLKYTANIDIITSFMFNWKRLEIWSALVTSELVSLNMLVVLILVLNYLHIHKMLYLIFLQLSTENGHWSVYSSRRLLRSSRPQEIFQPPQQGFFSVHAQLQLLGKIFLLHTSPHLTPCPHT